MVEAEAIQRARESLSTGCAVMFRYDLQGAGPRDPKPICGGSMRLLVDPTFVGCRDEFQRVMLALGDGCCGFWLTTLSYRGEIQHIEVTSRFVAESESGSESTLASLGDLNSLLAGDTGRLVAASDHPLGERGLDARGVRLEGVAARDDLDPRFRLSHGREAAMIFSSAYATMIGTFVPLVTEETALVSDELNHNCIINAIRLSRPKEKRVYRHNDIADCEEKLAGVAGACRRALVITAGIFSMRGDRAPLHEILTVARQYDARFPENVVVIVDDSHGVGAYGPMKYALGFFVKTGDGAADRSQPSWRAPARFLQWSPASTSWEHVGMKLRLFGRTRSDGRRSRTGIGQRLDSFVTEVAQEIDHRTQANYAVELMVGGERSSVDRSSPIVP